MIVSVNNELPSPTILLHNGNFNYSYYYYLFRNPFDPDTGCKFTISDSNEEQSSICIRNGKLSLCLIKHKAMKTWQSCILNLDIK
jgi:hypothetical protein